jgi:hypothetical protein
VDLASILLLKTSYGISFVIILTSTGGFKIFEIKWFQAIPSMNKLTKWPSLELRLSVLWTDSTHSVLTTIVVM